MNRSDSIRSALSSREDAVYLEPFGGTVTTDHLLYAIPQAHAAGHRRLVITGRLTPQAQSYLPPNFTVEERYPHKEEGTG